ncbi:class II aldolase/adducin family protein [Nitrospirillum sp. BR 11163]|uniref:class II aldolase/adducin family protein n=1 Tax=Nitrospirillum sp. BR 11163 TaxID=3104323 RepID=UPI002AFEAF53|nr:class II aldolase/adducin family protein [Nitrospirillum sp. BR 11163]MEA1674655.1 class II aldolase/adducin family protein [Nitrospirillum sp. BR 11163]
MRARRLASGDAPPPAITTVPRQGNEPRWELPAPQPTPEAERQHRKQRLAAAFRLFARHGFESGLAGHFSARDPIHTDHFWINPLGVSYSHIRASDLILVDGREDVLHGDGLLNLSGLPYHDAIQRARPEVVGIAHAHSFYGKVWSAFGRPVEPITADAGLFHEDQALFDPVRTPGRSYEQDRDTVVAQAVAALGAHNTLIWQNHGFWTVGATVEAAAWRFIALEDAARAQLLAQSAGNPIVTSLPSPTAAARARLEVLAYLSFLPLWDRVVREEPDLLD